MRLRSSFIEGEPGALLCVELYGDRQEDLPPRLQALERDLRERGLGYRYHYALDLPGQARIWSLREAALGLSMAMKGDAKSLSFVEDTAVAPEKLRDYIEKFLELVQRHGTSAGVYAHASVGCLHVRPVVNLKTEEGVRRFEAIANAVADLALEYGGALSGEHGDGLVRSPFMQKMFGPVLYEAFRTIKRTFDPQGIFNPGKIVDAPPLTANLRYGAGYTTPTPGHVFRLLGVRRPGRRRRHVQRPWRLPEEARRHDVPVVHGHAGRGRFNPRPRERPAPRDGGADRRSGPWRRRRLRRAGSLPRMPRVQSRMSRRRRHGAVQERVSRRLLVAARRVEARARARARTDRWRSGGVTSRRSPTGS